MALWFKHLIQVAVKVLFGPEDLKNIGVFSRGLENTAE